MLCQDLVCLGWLQGKRGCPWFLTMLCLSLVNVPTVFFASLLCMAREFSAQALISESLVASWQSQWKEQVVVSLSLLQRSSVWKGLSYSKLPRIWHRASLLHHSLAQPCDSVWSTVSTQVIHTTDDIFGWTEWFQRGTQWRCCYNNGIHDGYDCLQSESETSWNVLKTVQLLSWSWDSDSSDNGGGLPADGAGSHEIITCVKQS